jgi:hypothetical protein
MANDDDVDLLGREDRLTRLELFQEGLFDIMIAGVGVFSFR